MLAYVQCVYMRVCVGVRLCLCDLPRANVPHADPWETTWWTLTVTKCDVAFGVGGGMKRTLCSPVCMPRPVSVTLTAFSFHTNLGRQLATTFIKGEIDR